MADYLVDTNHLSAPIKPVSFLREQLIQAVREGHRLVTCVPVLCELHAGIQKSKKADAYRRQLDQMLKYVRIWPLEPPVAPAYAAVYHETIRRGRVLSQVDMILAALASLKDLTILTSDQDFAAVKNLRIENWLT